MRNLIRRRKETELELVFAMGLNNIQNYRIISCNWPDELIQKNLVVVVRVRMIRGKHFFSR
jgi:hypothetical protein